MDYVELQVTVTPYSVEAMDIAISALADIGFESFTEAKRGFCAYIPAPGFQENEARITLQSLSAARYLYTFSEIPDQNWNAVWESNFDPIVVDGRCTIRAPFHSNLPATEFEVVMEPKMAFGTGHHETTYLCTQALLNRDVQNLEVLDMGCGTGVLAMVAIMKGAAHADAIDIDEWSYNSALENSMVNNVADKITAQLGDASLLPTSKYDLILANISRNVLLQDMPRYAQALKANSTLIVSGIFTSDVDTVAQAAQENGLNMIAQQEREGWASVEFKMVMMPK
ncbi:MAG: 50S ribosomal protein L11 methyltransferase [Prevotellaceae bacterium]|jgi:ribosomal protein L11 methyltransferase|nr:50S ribosomal protein L11 methyltransferase [Prevotellaceae bacterium]